MFGTKTKTVDGIMAAFQTTIADLRDVANAETVAAAEQERIAKEALAKKAENEAEATRATTLAEKLAAVFTA